MSTFRELEDKLDLKENKERLKPEIASSCVLHIFLVALGFFLALLVMYL